jgi:hypothetical protein
MLQTMIPTLNQLGQEVNIFVGKGSIEKSLLLSKSPGFPLMFQGGHYIGLQRRSFATVRR